MFENLGNILLAALGISFLIFMHELGHFLAARWFGVRVETFSIGFGPRIAGWRSGDTDYRISIIPLGGYVKLAGEYGDPVGDDVVPASDDLLAKPIWQRFVIFSGGVAMNFALAFVIFPVAFGAGVPFEAPVLGGVAAGGPAWNAGLRPGDEVLAVSGRRTYGFSNILNDVALCDPDDLVLTIRRDGVESDVRVTPERSSGLYDIGVAPSFEIVPEGPAAAAGLSADDRIVAVNGIEVGAHAEGALISPALGVQLAERDGEPLELVVERDGRRVPLVIEPVVTPPTGETRPLGARPTTTLVAALRQGAPIAPLRHGDVITAVNDVLTVSVADLYRALGRLPDGAALRVLRDGVEVDLHVPAPAVTALMNGDVAFGAAPLARIQVVFGSALHRAGLEDGDTIVALDDTAVATFEDLLAVMNANQDRVDYRVRYARNGVETTVAVRTMAMPSHDYGVPFSPITVVYDLSFAGSLRAGWDASLDAMRATALTLTKLFTGDVGTDQLSGPIQISQVTYTLASKEFSRLLFFLALLSVNLGVINILPIPVLDGGQILFLLLEKIKGARLSERFMANAQLAGLVMILALMVYVTFNDISRLLS